MSVFHLSASASRSANLYLNTTKQHVAPEKMPKYCVNLQKHFAKFGSLAEDRRPRHGVKDNAAAMFECVDACEAGLNRLMGKLNKIRQGMATTGLRSIPSTLLYPFRESTIAKLKEIVTHDLMSNLAIAINVLNL